MWQNYRMIVTQNYRAFKIVARCKEITMLYKSGSVFVRQKVR